MSVRHSFNEDLLRIGKAAGARPILCSLLGASSSIFLMLYLNQKIQLSLLFDDLFLSAFGASAVLVFAAPQSAFSQPKNLIGGHIISAFIGICVFKYVPCNHAVRGTLALTLALYTMLLSNTLHPPGGSTALISAIGSDEIEHQGYYYLLFPVTSGALFLLAIWLIMKLISPNKKPSALDPPQGQT